MKQKNTNYFFIISLLLVCLDASSMLRMVTYDEVRAEGGFNSPSMSFVSRIIPSGDPLDEDEINALITSQTLTRLNTLDLSQQNLITDDHIATFCNNSTFRRIING